MQEHERRLLDQAVRSLGHRDHSTAEIEAKLERAGAGAAEREEVLTHLTAAGYLDDGGFARSRAAALAGRGAGDEAIRHDLLGRGLTGEAVEAALAGLEPESERAQALVASLGGGPRAARALVRKGFGEDAVEAALASIAQDE